MLDTGVCSSGDAQPGWRFRRDFARYAAGPGNRVEHRLGAGLSDLEVEVFLTAVIAPAVPVATHFLWRPQLRDPSDEMVLEAAVNGHAC